MCPLYPFHLVLLYLCLLLPLLLAVVEGSEELFANWKVSFLPRKLDKVTEGDDKLVRLLCEGCANPATGLIPPGLTLALMTDDPRVATAEHQHMIREEGEEEDGDGDGDDGREILLSVDDLRRNSSASINGSSWTVPFRVRANFLGFAKIRSEVRDAGGKEVASTPQVLSVTAVRRKTLESKLFAYSVATLISLAYINMGCALDLKVRGRGEKYIRKHSMSFPVILNIWSKVHRREK